MRILRDSEQYENHVLNRILTCSFAGKSTVSDRVWVIEGGTLSPSDVCWFSFIHKSEKLPNMNFAPT